jgi:hypothetical protein
MPAKITVKECEDTEDLALRFGVLVNRCHGDRHRERRKEREHLHDGQHRITDRCIEADLDEAGDERRHVGDADRGDRTGRPAYQSVCCPHGTRGVLLETRSGVTYGFVKIARWDRPRSSP